MAGDDIGGKRNFDILDKPMSVYNIDEIHEKLDGVERELKGIGHFRRSPRDTLGIERFPVLWSVIHDLRFEGLIYKLNITNTLANRFQDIDGWVRVEDALVVAERVRSWLRSEDQRFSELENSDDHEYTLPEDSTKPNVEPTISASNWVYVDQRSIVKKKILHLSVKLEDVLQIANNSNYPPDMVALTELERTQLIVLLETTLAMLKAPMVETGLLRKLQKTSSEMIKKTAKKKAEAGMGSLLDNVVDIITEIFKGLG